MTGSGFAPWDVDPTHLIYAFLGGFVVIFGMFSLLLKEKMYLGEAPIATVFGIIIGPYVLNLFDPRGWADPVVSNKVTLEVTRVVLAIGLFAIGVELPGAYLWRHRLSVMLLLIPLMTFGWLVSAGLVYALIPGVSFLSALVIGACLTPTDPVLAAAVVGGKYAIKHVPEHLRHLLAAESAVNDGLAFPFLFFGIYLTLEHNAGTAIGKWIYMSWLYEVTFGTIFGAALGYGFRELMKFCERKGLIDRHSYVAQYVSLSLLTIGATTMLGSDDLLAAFACGTAFTWDRWFNKQTEESQFSNIIDLLFNCACFIYIGAWIPFHTFSSAELNLSPWRLIVITILILIFRRLPAILAMYKWIPDVKNLREALFTGHFGPMGVGAVFISSLASHKLPVPQSPPQGQTEFLAATVQPIVAFVVLCSIVTHGLSIPFFSLGRRVQSIRTQSRRPTMEPGTLPEWTTQVRRFGSLGDSTVTNRKARSSPPAEKERTRFPSDSEDSGDVREWKEGSDLVVEVPVVGQERRVKVFKDVFPVSEEGGALKEARELVRDDVEAFVKRVKEEVKEVAKHTESPSGGSEGHEAEEWADEPESVDAAPARGVTFDERVKPSRAKKDAKSRRHSVSSTNNRFGSGRRREAIRRMLAGSAARKSKQKDSDSVEIATQTPSAASSATPSSVDLGANDAPRGHDAEASPASPTSPVVLSRKSSLRPPTRTSSPAPSKLRFADERDPPAVKAPSGLVDVAEVEGKGAALELGPNAR